MRLTPVMEKYILHWGEMGARWGTNRSVAQIHALLFLSPRPLHAEEIVETLEIARSNVSTSLRELQGWGIVKMVHVRGDRRDHFEALQDNWEMLTTIVEERKKREIDPTLTMLRACAIEAADDPNTPDEIKARIQGQLEFIETLAGWYDQVKNIPKPTLISLMKMGSRVARFVGMGGGRKSKVPEDSSAS
jgi:DNA-binding transcriptional regulator GbsR (MarR family)